MLIISCRKETNDIPEGTYSGNFSRERLGTNTGETDIVTLTLDKRTYACSKGMGDINIASNGTYTTKLHTLCFKDKINHPLSVDNSRLLAGEFTYTFHDDQLSLVANFGDSVMARYTLQKIR